MVITSYFSNLGVPATGLSPTIRIRDLSTNSLVVTDAPMTEVGDGFYKYNFITYAASNNYTARADGTATLPNAERYQTWSNGATAASSASTSNSLLGVQDPMLRVLLMDIQTKLEDIPQLSSGESNETTAI